jgi:hypothetical protein
MISDEAAMRGEVNGRLSLPHAVAVFAILA